MNPLANSIIGIVTGVGGSLISNIFNHVSAKQKNAHELALIKANSDALQKEVELSLQRTRAETDAQLQMAAQASFDISLKSDNPSGPDTKMVMILFKYKWTVWLGVILVFIISLVEVMRIGMRPALTLGLMAVTTYLLIEYYHIYSSLKQFLNITALNGLIETFIYLTTVAIGWWFGDRTISKAANEKSRR